MDNSIVTFISNYFIAPEKEINQLKDYKMEVV